jgi:heptosyltransferase-1
MKHSFEIPLPERGDRLLFIRFSSLGDVLLALKKAKALKTRFPGLHLTWLAQVEYEGILRMQPYVDDVLTWDITKGRFTVFPLIRLVRNARYQFLYSVHFNDRSALVSAFSGIPHRVGYHKNLRFAYDYPLGVAKEAWELPELGEEEVLLRVSVKQKRSLLEKVPGNESRFLFCAIGASKGFKRWPSRSWSKFLSEAAGMGLKPVLVGNGVEEEGIAREIVSTCPFEVVDLVGKLSLEEVCALATLSESAVGGDTGPIHLARMAGIPCIGLFAVRDPSRYGHKGKNLVPLVSESPYENYPERVPVSCPLASIQPERVIQEMKKIMASR